MSKNKEYKATINANGSEISIVSKGNEDDYISLTDIANIKVMNQMMLSVIGLEIEIL